MERGMMWQRMVVVGTLALTTGCSTAGSPASPEGVMASRDPDRMASSPLQAAGEVLDRNPGFCTVITVPAGHRLVIETVSGRMGRFRDTDPLAGPVIKTTLSGVAQRHWLSREFIGTNATLNLDVYMLTHHLRLYADAGTPVVIETPDAVGSFAISGFLVKLP